MNYLFIANSSKPSEALNASTEKYFPTSFSKPCIEGALALGLNVYMGINRNHPEKIPCDYNIQFYNMAVYRNPFNIKEITGAYKNAMKLLTDTNFELIHCNTPIGGVIGRICGRKAKARKVIYTAHGFHFYKGAPLKNWLIYYPIERWLAHYTDAIITINREDYELARKFKLKKGGKVYFVPGVGISLSEYEDISAKREEKRSELNFKSDDVVLISMGDLIIRKNYSVAIQAIKKARNPNLHYMICGNGPELDNLKQLSESLGISSQIHFLGFRTDIIELLSAADIFLFTTLQEGLPRSMMEAMAAGLPCVVSKIRGNVDLIEDGEGGYLCASSDVGAFAGAISNIANNDKLRTKMAQANLEKVKNFDVSVVEKEIRNIYHEVLHVTPKNAEEIIC